jgi:hypothetical protein
MTKCLSRQFNYEIMPQGMRFLTIFLLAKLQQQKIRTMDRKNPTCK